MKKNNAKHKKNIDLKIKGDLEGRTVGKIVIILIVVFSFFSFYLLTVTIVNKNKNVENKSSNDSIEPTISYDKIIAGRSFSMGDDEYYVIYYDSSDKENSSIYSELVSTYKAKGDSIPIYFVDMADGLNKNFSTTDESNKTPTEASDLLINGPTLIRINDGKVISYIEGEINIKNSLN